MKNSNANLKCIIFAALLAALDIATLRLIPQFYLPPGTFVFRVSPQFLWFGVAGWLMGPGWAMAMGMCADIIGALINPGGSGMFFPGYTLTAGLSALCYGLVLFGRKPAFWRCVVAVSMHMLLIALPLTSLWSDLQGFTPSFWEPFWLALPWRLGAVLPFSLLLFGIQKLLLKPASVFKL